MIFFTAHGHVEDPFLHTSAVTCVTPRLAMSRSCAFCLGEFGSVLKEAVEAVRLGIVGESSTECRRVGDGESSPRVYEPEEAVRRGEVSSMRKEAVRTSMSLELFTGGEFPPPLVCSSTL
jgi:hypothetical protein